MGMCFILVKLRNHECERRVMGLLNFFVKKAVKANVRVLTHSYLTVKQKNPDRDEKELYALALESRHSYERDSSNPLAFTYKNLTSMYRSLNQLNILLLR